MIANKDLNLNNNSGHFSLTYGRNVDAESLRELQVGSTELVAANLQSIANVDE